MFGPCPISKPQFACSGFHVHLTTHPPIPGRPRAVRGSAEGRVGRSAFSVFSPKSEPDRDRRGTGGQSPVAPASAISKARLEHQQEAYRRSETRTPLLE